ncbi:MAG: glycosyltransferase, partial [Coriobacteriales bacterium]|nr:glycosyltransferase [Coriobacteriales bacterium]
HTQFGYELDRLHLKGFCKNTPLRWAIKTFNLCDECYTVNKAIKKIYRELGVDNKISIIPNATDLKTSKSIEKDKNWMNKKFGINKDENVLLFVGRISLVKNLMFLLESLKILSDRDICFTMLFVGPFEDKKPFYRKIKKLGLDAHIKVCGKIYDRDLLQKIYTRADLLLLPSYYDTDSLVQIEAASQFTPTVFIEDAPTASNIIDNHNGFIAPEDTKKYADKIAFALNNKNLLQKVSKNCHDTIYLKWQDVSKILYKKYRKIL